MQRMQGRGGLWVRQEEVCRDCQKGFGQAEPLPSYYPQFHS